MAPQTIVHKKWMAKQLQHSRSLKTLAGMHKFQATLLQTLQDEKAIKAESLTAGDVTTDEIAEIFGLKFTGHYWEQRQQSYDVPKSLVSNLRKLRALPYDTKSEAYSRITIDFLIIDCIWKYSKILSEQSGLPTDNSIAATAAAPIFEQSELSTNDLNTAESSHIAPSTPLMALKNTFPLKVFKEMALSVRVEKGNKNWTVSGIADWALGHGERAVLADGAVLLAVEAKQKGRFDSAEPQLLAYLATIRQLRIQANKKNVTTQGFFSDGRKYSFMCIRNDGTVIVSRVYNVFYGDLKVVFNFLLNILITAAESSPNTSRTKPGEERDEKIENFDRDVFVKVFEDVSTTPISLEEIEEEDELPDIIIEEE